METRSALLLAAVAGGVALLVAGTRLKAQDTRSRPASRSRPAAKAQPPAKADFGPFVLKPNPGWKTVRPPLSAPGVRKAEYQLPPPGDEKTEAGDLIVYYFGKRGAGSTEANIDRWRGQFLKPAGMSDEDFSVRVDRKVDGLEVTTLQVRGTYVEPSFGPRTARKPDKPDYMLLAAVIETKDGPYYLHATGPEKTLEHWKKAWNEMIAGIVAKKAEKSTEGAGEHPQEGGR